MERQRSAGSPTENIREGIRAGSGEQRDRSGEPRAGSVELRAGSGELRTSGDPSLPVSSLHSRQPTAPGQASREQSSREQSSREQSSREQDRRLERSLYEGHSIEAGLNYEAGSGAEASGSTASERTFLDHGDGTERLFPYAEPYADASAATGPPLNPEAVRGAILRLARESRPMLESVAGSKAVSQAYPEPGHRAIDPASSSGDQDTLAGNLNETQTAPTARSAAGLPATASRELSISAQADSPVQSAPPDFADVARRVWAREAAESVDSVEKETSLAFMEDGLAAARDGKAAQRYSYAQVGGAHRIAEDLRGLDVRELEVRGLDMKAAPARRGIPATPSPIGIQQAQDTTVIPPLPMALQQVSTLRGSLAAQQESVSPPPPQAGAQTGGKPPDGRFEDAALAHDACNLLSALGLYSDLLNVPGVLDESHRHYAEELKLIAVRSRRLVDRLLRLGSGSDASRSGSDASLHLVGQGASLGTARGGASSEVQQDGAFENALLANETPLGTEPGPFAAPESEAWPISLVDLLMRWGSLLSTLAHGTLDVSFGPQAATPVAIAAESLERILVNLVKNARAATVNGGAIRIGVGVADREPQLASDLAASEAGHPVSAAGVSHRSVVLTVDDSGCGMSEADVMQILLSEHSDGVARLPTAEPRHKTASGSDVGPQRPIARAPGDPGGEETAQEIQARLADQPATDQRSGLKTGSAFAAPESAAAQPSASGVAGRGSKNGRGLGLRVVKGLVAETGGTLQIYSRLGRGTRIEIRWPSADSVAVTARPAAAPELCASIATQQVTPGAPLTSSFAHLPPLPASPVEPPPIGPDGFSEQELRSMMLRLHRTGASDQGHAKSMPNRRHSAQERPGTSGPSTVQPGIQPGIEHRIEPAIEHGIEPVGRQAADLVEADPFWSYEGRGGPA